MRASTSPSQTARTAKVEGQYWHAKGFLGLYSRVFLRTTQFILSLLLIALYSPDFTNATSTNSRVQTPWIIAMIICILSAVTCIFHVFTTVKRVALVCVWDAILMVVWAAITGTFGVIFTGDREGKETLRAFASDRTRMQVVVWFDLVMVVLWGATTLQGCVWCCVARTMTRGTVVPGNEEQVEMADLELGDIEAGGAGKRRNKEERSQGEGFERENLALEVERNGNGNGNSAGNSRNDGEWRSSVKDGQELKKVDSPPPPAYARFSV